MRDIGSMLREGRQARGLEIGEVARRTCISGHYLKAMEEGKFHLLPKVFDKGYLKIYAKLLGLDVTILLGLYEQRKNGVPAHPLMEARSA